jgi:UTP:GlnB (protein PII) uridylyltransferase
MDMKPSLEELVSSFPELDKKLAEEHLKRLGEDYFNKFNQTDIRSHIESISRLSISNPVEVNVVQKRDKSIECTVTAYDYPSEFSLITGILAGMGFNIISGDVYTYKKIEKVNKGRSHKIWKKRQGLDNGIHRQYERYNIFSREG